MSVRLSEASVEELNAAFDAVQDKIELLIANFIPSFFKRQAMEELHSPRGKALLLDAVDAAIDAVEETRKKNEAATKVERKGP